MRKLISVCLIFLFFMTVTDRRVYGVDADSVGGLAEFLQDRSGADLVAAV